ncbi:MAG TPA: hypothetical protein VMT10_07905, partial [Solirubrobacteraceae bacterium]|nr:hypothetical protein [Solirubrobacteraceae bacterium]
LAASVDDEAATLSVANAEIGVTIEDQTPYRFALEADKARALGESILARPVSYEVECPSCARRSWAETRLAPTSEVAEARARSEHWTCPHCGHRVISGDLVGYDDDVWRGPPEGGS